MMTVHPACDLFPLMDEKALHRLTEDIRANGLVNPIVLHEGQIVDGRNRLRACSNAAVEPRFTEWRSIYTGAMPLSRWIWSVNSERRHMTDEQILAAEVAIRALEERESARQRQAEGLKSGPAGRWGDVVPTKSTEPDKQLKEKGETREKIAQATGASAYKVQQALNVQKADPDLLKQVAQGNISLLDANRQVTGKTEKSKREQIVENAARRRMISGLSHIDGACKGLAELNVSSVRGSCPVDELKEWAGMARNLAKQLRTFAEELLNGKDDE